MKQWQPEDVTPQMRQYFDALLVVMERDSWPWYRKLWHWLRRKVAK